MTTPPPRIQLGFIEEYWLCVGSVGGYGRYAGHRAVKVTAQQIGTDGGEVYMLAADIEIDRSFSKKRTLKKGTLVRRVVFPLEGRAITQ